MNRTSIALIVSSLTALVACSGGPNDSESVASSQAAVIGVDTFLYLRCNTTGWNPSDATRFVASGTPGVFEVSFEVVEGWMLDSNDYCQLTERISGTAGDPFSRATTRTA